MFDSYYGSDFTSNWVASWEHEDLWFVVIPTDIPLYYLGTAYIYWVKSSGVNFELSVRIRCRVKKHANESKHAYTD